MTIKNELFTTILIEKILEQQNELAQTISKTDVHQNKIMLLICWKNERIIYLKFLPHTTKYQFKSVNAKTNQNTI